VTASFKDIKKKFVQEGIKESEIDIKLEEFKEAKDKNKIKGVDRDISEWMHRSWHDFSCYIDWVKNIVSNSEQRKQPWKSTVSGAKKVAENNDWVIFRIDTDKASSILGSRNWCTTRGSLETYKPIYYALSKNRSYKIKWVDTNSEDNDYKVTYENPMHRLALFKEAETDAHFTCYDAHQKAIKNPDSFIKDYLKQIEGRS
jgi:hypothetical protein